MRVVVTGAAGLLGTFVVDALLDAGHDVRAVDLVPPRRTDIEFVQADLTDTGAAIEVLQQVDAVVHAAAHPRPLGRTAADVFRTNVLAAFSVLQATTLLEIPRLVNASSISVLGVPFNVRPVAFEYLPIDEAHPSRPQEAYGMSKLVTEEIVSAAVRRSDLRTVSLRMPWIQTQATFHAEVVPLRDDPISARNLFAYVDARDVGAAFAAALSCPCDGHEIAFLSAPDTFMDVETERLVADRLPGVPHRGSLEGFAPLLDTSRASALLDWRARHSWRSYDTAAS